MGELKTIIADDEPAARSNLRELLEEFPNINIIAEAENGRIAIEKIRKEQPDLVFLDAHPYDLTKNIVNECLSRKINFMCHDVSYNIGHDVAKKRSKNFNQKRGTDAQWELYVLCELIDEKLWQEDYFENNDLIYERDQDKYGLGIVTHK